MIFHFNMGIIWELYRNYTWNIFPFPCPNGQFHPRNAISAASRRRQQSSRSLRVCKNGWHPKMYFSLVHMVKCTTDITVHIMLLWCHHRECERQLEPHSRWIEHKHRNHRRNDQSCSSFFASENVAIVIYMAPKAVAPLNVIPVIPVIPSPVKPRLLSNVKCRILLWNWMTVGLGRADWSLSAKCAVQTTGQFTERLIAFGVTADICAKDLQLYHFGCWKSGHCNEV